MADASMSNKLLAWVIGSCQNANVDLPWLSPLEGAKYSRHQFIATILLISTSLVFHLYLSQQERVLLLQLSSNYN